MKVYVLTAGEYSDYRIEGVFSSIKALEAGKAKLGAGFDSNDPEEYELDEMLQREVGPEFVVKISVKDGEIVQRFQRGDHLRHPKECRVWSEFLCGNKQGMAVGAGSPISEEHALKVAVERRQKMLREDATNPKTFSETIAI